MQRNVAFPRRCQAYSCLPCSMHRTGAKLRLLLILFGPGFNVGSVTRIPVVVSARVAGKLD